MTIASCGSIDAISLCLPKSSAIPADKATLPKGLFVAKTQVSVRVKQQLAKDVESITMLALLRAANTGLQAGTRIPEVLVIGLRMHTKNAAMPTDVVELIASQRKSGILFVCVRDVDVQSEDGNGEERQECAFAVRRTLPGRAGHTAAYGVYASAWMPAEEAMLEVAGTTIDELWESLCSQTILGSTNYTDVDARIVRREQVRRLEAEIDKLTRDHKRAKNPAQRNEIFAKLQKAKKQLEACQS